MTKKPAAAQVEQKSAHKESAPSDLSAPTAAPFVVEQPLILMFEAGSGNLMTHLWPRATDTYQGYGLMIADIIRHVAHYFHVEPDDVHDWVKKELRRPTTDIKRPS